LSEIGGRGFSLHPGKSKIGNEGLKYIFFAVLVTTTNV